MTRDWLRSQPLIKLAAMVPGSSQAHPHLKNGTAYRQVRPTKLDKIKNLPDQVQVGDLRTEERQPKKGSRATVTTERADCLLSPQ